VEAEVLRFPAGIASRKKHGRSQCHEKKPFHNQLIFYKYKHPMLIFEQEYVKIERSIARSLLRKEQTGPSIPFVAQNSSATPVFLRRKESAPVTIPFVERVRWLPSVFSPSMNKSALGASKTGIKSNRRQITDVEVKCRRSLSFSCPKPELRYR